MQGFEDALAHAQLRSTNPNLLERFCYTLWIHLLIAWSNVIEDGHLWTTSEFPVGVGRRTYTDIFAQAKFEQTPGAYTANYNERTTLDELFFTSSNRAETPVRNPNKRRREADGSPLGQLPSASYELNTPQIFPHVKGTTKAIDTGASDSPDSGGNASNKVTPAQTARDENQQWEKIYRTRIVDFAVLYLSSDDRKRVKIHNNELHDFNQVKAPVVVKGKRPPSHDGSEEEFHDELTMLLTLAQQDIEEKKLFFFEVYGCMSFAAIAFAGAYWTFTICKSGLFSPLVWSKPIYVKSNLHSTVLDTMFQAAEQTPNNPGGHYGLQALLEKHKLESDTSFEFAEV